MPAPDYATLALLKESIGIPDADETRDTLLEQALATASRQIDDKTGRRFYLDDTATARVYSPRGQTVRTADGDMLLVDDLGVAPTAVEYGIGSTYTALTATDYLTDPDNALVRSHAITGLIRINAAWPAGSGYRIRVTGKWGWPAVPDPIAQATLILATRLFKRKDSPEGVMGSADFGFIRMGRTDPDVQALIDPYILPGIA